MKNQRGDKQAHARIKETQIENEKKKQMEIL